MPVVATTASPIVVTVDQVRRFMRDFPQNNILLDDVEFTDTDVAQGAEFVTSAYNAVTPQSNITVQGWPASNQYILLLGIAWYLIRSASFLQLRNQATYQDGDIAPIGIDDKFPLYTSLWQSLKEEWDIAVRAIKTQNNLESAYGGFSSGYLNVARYQYK